MSTGLYSITTRAAGTVLTASVYNSDHQNHVTNQNPSMTGAYADNISQFQAAIDPGDVGTESLPASLADELSRVRAMFARIFGLGQWYAKPGAANAGRVPVVKSDGSGLGLSVITGDANLLVNPAMDFDQRNESASVAVATGNTRFITDQWQVAFIGVATGVTGQRVVDAPPGLSYSLKVTIGTGSATVNATDALQILQNIEATSITDLGFGAAGADPVSVGFWVKSSLTGTFGYSLRNAGNTRSYVGTFTISVANTWQFVPVANVAGDTTGAWAISAGVGLSLAIVLMAGATLQTATVNAWQAGNFLTTSGQTNVAATTGATFQVTGFDLREGPVVVPLHRRKAQAEQALCQRYYEKSYDSGTAVGAVTTAGRISLSVNYTVNSTYTIGRSESFKVTKRATPAVSLFSTQTGTSGRMYDTTNAADVVVAASSVGLNGFTWSASVSASTSTASFGGHFAADASL